MKIRKRLIGWEYIGGGEVVNNENMEKAVTQNRCPTGPGDGGGAFTGSSMCGKPAKSLLTQLFSTRSSERGRGDTTLPGSDHKSHKKVHP